MIRKIILFVLLLFLTVSATGVSASGAAGCTVKYYYTSERNPEKVPAATSGVQSGSGWKIKPTGPSKTVYIKTVNGRTMAYTFDGWYTNMNCRGTKYPPGKETTAIVPSSSSGGYTVSLYGRWIYSEGSTAPTTTAAPVQSTNKAPKKTNTASKKTSSDSKNPASGSKDVTAATTPKSSPTAQEKADSKAPVTVSISENRSREEALADWRHLLIDTFFHVNDRKYSCAAPGKYWTDSKGVWSGRTGRNGNTQSCITLPSVSLKRTGIIPASGGNIWLSSNMSSKPNRTVKKLQKTSKMLTIFYPHRSLKYMAARGTVKFGDILCRSGHTFVYMGNDSEGHPLIYESGSHRDIGNGTGVTWGHHSGGHANKLTGKINKQIKNSNTIGDKWRRGEISDSAFKGHRATGNNLNKPIHIVCSINTFNVKTSCTNGTITPGSTFMAGQNVNISYSPSEGMTIDSIMVDGKNVDVKVNGSSFCFARISSDHTISVVYK